MTCEGALTVLLGCFRKLVACGDHLYKVGILLGGHIVGISQFYGHQDSLGTDQTRSDKNF